MELLTPILLVVIGLVLLGGGGEALVRSATTLAAHAGVTPAVIGLTVVAIGTSLPELVVSVVAAYRDQPDLAVANVVGSNIFNVAATIGIAALILPLPVHGTAVRLEWPFMFTASFVCLLLARDGTLDRMEGGFFVVALTLFVAFTVRMARRELNAEETQSYSAETGTLTISPKMVSVPVLSEGGGQRLWVSLALVAVGMVLLVIGGRLLVDGAVSIARIAGVSERVIGLTIVAGGTGAPELATSVVAALRKRADVAVANMIGSNIFNILGILGITALLLPIPVAPALVSTDMWWMLGTSFLLLPLMHTGERINRLEGGLLLAIYGVYIAVLLRR